MSDPQTPSPVAALNAQIVGAVAFENAKSPEAAMAVTRAARDMVVQQALAIAVQDAVTHMRQVNLVACAAMSVSGRMMLHNENVEAATAAMTSAQKLVEGATANFNAICDIAVRLGAPPQEKTS